MKIEDQAPEAIQQEVALQEESRTAAEEVTSAASTTDSPTVEETKPSSTLLSTLAIIFSLYDSVLASSSEMESDIQLKDTISTRLTASSSPLELLSIEYDRDYKFPVITLKHTEVDEVLVISPFGVTTKSRYPSSLTGIKDNVDIILFQRASTLFKK